MTDAPRHPPVCVRRHLKGLQKESGEILGFGGDWALTSFAAAGVAPADVNKAGKESSDARSWIDPQEAELTGTAPAKKTPLNFLISQQVSGGGFRYSTSGSTADEYASQDAVRALGSGGFTAAPPAPAKGEQWKGVTEFATGETETTSLALIVNNGTSPLKICSVSLAPKATTTSLATVLDAAVKSTTPATIHVGDTVYLSYE